MDLRMCIGPFAPRSVFRSVEFPCFDVAKENLAHARRFVRGLRERAKHFLISPRVFRVVDEQRGGFLSGCVFSLACHVPRSHVIWCVRHALRRVS